MVLICFFISGISLVKGQLVYGNQKDSYEIILPSGIIVLETPITVEDIQFYEDGGTIGVIIKDKNDKKFMFCLDGRMQEIKFGETPKPTHVYVGAVYPETKGAQSIPIGGKEEKSILDVLQAWLDQELSSDEKEALLTKNSVIGLSEKELKAHRILHIIKSLKNRQI